MSDTDATTQEMLLAATLASMAAHTVTLNLLVAMKVVPGAVVREMLAVAALACEEIPHVPSGDYGKRVASLVRQQLESLAGRLVTISEQQAD